MLWIIGIGLTCVSILRLARDARRPTTSPPRWLTILRDICESGAWLSAGLFLILIGASTTIAYAPPTLFMVVALCAAGSTWMLSRLLERVRKDQVTTVRAVLQIETERAIGALRRGLSIVAPDGWSEVRISLGTLDRAFSAGSMAKGYLVGVLVLLPGLLSFSFVTALYTGPTVQRDVFGHLAGYNALAILACATATLAAAVLAMVALRWTNVLCVRLDFGRMFNLIATYTGYGTAVGVVTVALLPIMTNLVPQMHPGNEHSVISPRLLLDVPAAFALIGFLIGALCGSVVLCVSAENLAIRRLLAPTVFAIALLVIFRLGAGPSSVLQMLLAQLKGPGMDCSAEAIMKRLTDTNGAFQVYLTCGDGSLRISDRAFGWSALILLAIAAIWAFIRDFRRRAHSTEATPPTALT